MTGRGSATGEGYADTGGTKRKRQPDPRKVHGYRRQKLRERVRAEGNPCHICGQPIDYSLPARHPMSYELDEVVPVSKGGSHLDYDNCKAAHRICNERKGARMKWTPKPSQKPSVTSRDW